MVFVVFAGEMCFVTGRKVLGLANKLFNCFVEVFNLGKVFCKLSQTIFVVSKSFPVVREVFFVNKTTLNNGLM